MEVGEHGDVDRLLGPQNGGELAGNKLGAVPLVPGELGAVGEDGEARGEDDQLAHALADVEEVDVEAAVLGHGVLLALDGGVEPGGLVGVGAVVVAENGGD